MCGQQQARRHFAAEEEGKSAGLYSEPHEKKESLLLRDVTCHCLSTLSSVCAKPFVFHASWLCSMGNNIKTGLTVLMCEESF